jgi:transcriptional regulator with XRE-family HTH domain
MPYQSPRMLAITLRRLRMRAGLTEKVLAGRIGKTFRSVSNYECRKNSVTYEVLDLYQRTLGIPNGIILTISHVAAMVRDAKLDPDESIRDREKEKLRYMARYLRNLSDSLVDSDGNLKLGPYPELSVHDEDTWEVVVQDLCALAQTGYNPEDATPFTDGRHLKIPTQPAAELDTIDLL